LSSARSIQRDVRLRPNIDVHACGQQLTGALDVTLASGKVQGGESVFDVDLKVGVRLDSFADSKGRVDGLFEPLAV